MTTARRVTLLERMKRIRRPCRATWSEVWISSPRSCSYWRQVVARGAEVPSRRAWCQATTIACQQEGDHFQPLQRRLAAGKLMYRRCSMTTMFALCLSDSAYALGYLQPRVVVICSELVWLNETCIALLRGVLLLHLQGRQATQPSRTSRVKKCWYEAVDDRLAPLRDKRQPRGKIMRR
jgi:hypothetical protein